MKSRKLVIQTLVAGALAVWLQAGGAQETQAGAGIKAKPMPGTLGSVSQQMLDGAGKDNKNWLISNGDYAQTRYYANQQINAKNVGKLKPAFVF
jgi:alcohol dehydrogenase (cytochrome c)